MTTLTVAQARSQFAEIVNRVNFGGERFLVTRHGKPVAAIGHVEDIEYIEQKENEIDLREARKVLRRHEKKSTAVPWADHKRQRKARGT